MGRRLRIERLEDRMVLGGGGENILLVVNPGDENALRIANAYQQLYDIPNNNIVFITPPISYGTYSFSLTQAQFTSTYVAPVAAAITARGLTNQINYIGLIGEAARYALTAGSDNSVTYGMSLLSPFSSGLSYDNAVQVATGVYQNPNNVPIGDNPAITHSQSYSINYGAGGVVNTQYYMSGAVGYTWVGGNSPDQVIADLQRAAAGNGTDPSGTVYFEDNGDIRSTTRDGEWSGTLIQTAAGGGSAGYGGDGGPAVNANLDGPEGAAVDSAGNLYITDTDNQRIREVNHATGVITTVAGNGLAGYGGDGGQGTAAELYYPSGIAIDSSGNLYIADTDNQRVRVVNHSTGIISTVAGNGTSGGGASIGDGGQATAAELDYAQGIAVDSAGNLYIADTEDLRIRVVNHSSGVITTLAGTGSYGFAGDNGPATAASVSYPEGVAVDSTGNLYIADTDNLRIREVNHSSGVITTVAGTGSYGFAGDNGPAAAASVSYPEGVAVDNAGNLYIADTDNLRIREVNHASGVITTLAGNGSSGLAGDGGLATAATLGYPRSTAVDSAGNLYITDSNNNRVRAVNSAGIIVTAAGSTFLGDGGQATAAALANAQGAALDSAGDLFIADTADNRIREVNVSTGAITTIAGNGTAGYSGDNGQASSAQLNSPGAIAVDTAGDIFIADTANNRVREVNHSTGVITTVAGNGMAGYNGDGSQASLTEINGPMGIAVDTAGDLFIADTGNNRIREVNRSGIITTVAGTGAAGYGGDTGQATAALLNGPAGVALDSAQNIYIADTGNNRVRKVNYTTSAISTVAGNGIAGFSGDGSRATGAEVNGPRGIALDTAGNLYIADTANSRVREVSSATGTISTFAGNASSGFGGDGGNATAAYLNGPIGLATDSAGDLFIADSQNNRIRVVLAQSTTEGQLTARGVPWVYEDNTSGSTPRNRPAVRGAVLGQATMTLPNGSTYIPGSWADDLTSYGCTWNDRSQTKSTMILASGAAATAGSVVEPYAIAARFTNSSIFDFIADGSTLGEAFAKSVQTPDIQEFVGDLLAQPYADVPSVNINSGPANGATVNGTITLSASAALVNPKIATGIQQLQLLVDGLVVSTASGSSTTFTLDTTKLSDGQHELRVVGVNNAAAASEAYASTIVQVNNLGRSVSISGGNLTIAGSQITPVAVSTTMRSGTVTQILLQCLGRTVGQINAASGTINLDPTQLAYEANTVTPVAVFSDGMQVAGTPITVTRNPVYMPGHTQSAAATRVSGLTGQYFYGQGGTTIASSTFSGTPSVTRSESSVNLFSGMQYYNTSTSQWTNYSNLSSPSPVATPTTSIDKLAVRLAGSFNVATAGEYEFFFWNTNDSAQLQIDGTPVLAFDGAQYGNTTMNGADLFLGAGEHDLTVLSSNTVTTSNPNYYDISLEYRGPDGITYVVGGSSSFYEVMPAVTASHITLGGTPTGTGGVYRVGDTVTATWNNTASGDNNSDPLTAVTMDFSQFGGPSAVPAANSGNVWTATYTILAGTIDATNCNVKVTASDNSGSTTAAGTTNATVDGIAPTITIGTPSGPVTKSGPITYSATYADPLFSTSTLTASDIALNKTGTANGTLSLAGSGTSYTVTINNITGDGTLGISIAAGTASDTAGNLALPAGPSTTFDVDNSGPVITISTPSLGITNSGPITYSVTYADPHFSTSTLTLSNITLNQTGTANGTLGLSGSGTSYTVTISSITGSGTLGISIAAGAASDTMGNLAAAAGPSATFSVVAYVSVEDFDTSNNRYTVVGATQATASTSTLAAHDGNHGLLSTSGNDWMYRNDAAAHVQQGDTISVWMDFPILADGRAYFTFGSSSIGTLSLVAAPNTNQFILQNNNGWGFLNLAATPQTWLTNHWYRLEVDWWTNGRIVGELFDSNGSTLLNSVTGSATVIASGGVGFRSLSGSVFWDTVQVLPGVNQSALSGTASPAASNATVASTSVPTSDPLIQTIAFSPLGDHRYGDTIALAAAASSGLPVSFTVISGPATITGNTLKVVGLGTVTVEAAQPGDADYLAAESYLSFKATPAPLTITAKDQSSIYGSALPVLRASYTGFVNGDTPASLAMLPTLTTSAIAASDVGSYIIMISRAADVDYTIIYVPGTLTITPASLTITADDQSSTDGSTLPALTASYAGFVNGDTSASLAALPTLTTSATAASGVGSYTIMASGAVAVDYTITYVPGTLTITPAPLTITADDQSSSTLSLLAAPESLIPLLGTASVSSPSSTSISAEGAADTEDTGMANLSAAVVAAAVLDSPAGPVASSAMTTSIMASSGSPTLEAPPPPAPTITPSTDAVAQRKAPPPTPPVNAKNLGTADLSLPAVVPTPSTPAPGDRLGSSSTPLTDYVAPLPSPPKQVISPLTTSLPSPPVSRESIKGPEITTHSEPVGRLRPFASPMTEATSARGAIAGFGVAGIGNFQPLRFTIADLAILEMLQDTADRGSAVAPTPAVDAQFSGWGIAAPPSFAAIPPPVDRINLPAMAEQVLESLGGPDGLDGLLERDSP